MTVRFLKCKCVISHSASAIDSEIIAEIALTCLFAFFGLDFAWLVS